MHEETERLLEDYFTAHRLNEKTRENITMVAAAFSRIMNRPLTESITGEELEEYYRRLIRRKYDPATVEFYLSRLRLLLKHIFIKAGFSKREAERKVEDLYVNIPLRELKREVKEKNSLRDKILTSEEMQRLIAAAEHPRLKAVVAVLYEAALRVGELVSLRIRDVEFKREYATLKVKGKTGERTIPIVKALPYLQAWLQIHPSKK